MNPLNTPKLEITFDRANKIYIPGELVTGTISVQGATNGKLDFEQISLVAEAYMDTVSLIRGNLGRGPLPPEKRIYFMITKEEVAKNGILFASAPQAFKFKLEATSIQGKTRALIDSYVGVDFSIVYQLNVSVKKVGEDKTIVGMATFDCKVPGGGIDPQNGTKNVPHDFQITPDEIDKTQQQNVPRFNFSGQIASVNCCFDEPFDGYLILKESEIQIRSIEIQLVRVETFEGKTNPTEIQNIQVADGNVLPDLEIPLYMLFPTCYSCSTHICPEFKIEFQVNLIVIFHTGFQLTENIPIRIFR